MFFFISVEFFDIVRRFFHAIPTLLSTKAAIIATSLAFLFVFLLPAWQTESIELIIL